MILDVIHSHIVVVTTDVFKTMLGWRVEEAEPYQRIARPQPLELRSMNGSIGFGGGMSATLFLATDEPLVRLMAGKIMGADIDPAMSDLSDVLGEITNMVAGGCKSRLCDGGFPVVMTIPNIIRGRSIRATGRDVQFMIQRRFLLPEINNDFQISLFGRLN